MNSREVNSLDDIIDLTLEEQISKWKEDGLTDAQIIEKIEHIDFPTMYHNLIDKASTDHYNFFKSSMFEIAFKERIETDEFIARLEQEWGECFCISQTMYTIAVESGNDYKRFITKYMEEKGVSDKEYTALSLMSIHGRACQEFLEILCLNRNGFADSAYARWRSMYELYCNAKFIVSYGEMIAKQFYLLRKVQEYNKFHQALQGRKYR